MQAYCYRVCLTSAPENMVPIAKPEGYDEATYEILFRALDAGYRGLWGAFCKFSPMPNKKTDSNNNGGISMNKIGNNYSHLPPEHPDYWDWTTLSHEGREEVAAGQRDWQRGLMAAGFLAALMSTIAAALNSVATLTAEDIYKRVRPETTDHQLVFIGRVTAAIVIVLAMLWSSQGGKFGSIFEAINKIPMAFAPGITTIFLFGVFWKRGNRQGAMAALLFNVAVGLVYLCIDIPLVGTKQLIAQELGIPFMQVEWYLFLMSSTIYVVVSLLTPAPTASQTEGLCWNRPFDALRGKLEGTVTDPRVMAGILLLIMILLYSWLK